MDFDNKVVVITGAASGMGAAIALKFAELKADLCIIDINESSLLNVKKQCEQLNKKKVKELVVDMSIDDELKKIVDNTLKEFKKIDVLVNCAGIYAPGNLQDSEMIASFDKIMAVNLRAVVVLTKEAAPALIKSKGCIVNISSIAAKNEYIVQNNIPYGISKAGVTYFTRAAALELAAYGVRVNSISPGPVKTSLLMNAGVSEEEHHKLWDRFTRRTALKRIVKAEEIAEMSAYLASDKAASITGADVVLDSGTVLGNLDDVLVSPNAPNNEA